MHEPLLIINKEKFICNTEEVLHILNLEAPNMQSEISDQEV